MRQYYLRNYRSVLQRIRAMRIHNVDRVAIHHAFNVARSLRNLIRGEQA